MGLMILVFKVVALFYLAPTRRVNGPRNKRLLIAVGGRGRNAELFIRVSNNICSIRNQG